MNDPSSNSTEERLAAFGRSLKERLAMKERAARSEAPEIEDGSTIVEDLEEAAPATPSVTMEGNVEVLRLDDVLNSPYQPRLRPITKADVMELMASIRATGQLTPIIVSLGAEPGKYFVHSGHRRCAALRYLNQSTVRAIVRRDLDERDARKLALADNLGREDLTAFEQANALREYANSFEVSFDDAAAQLGVQRRTASRLKTFFEATPELQEVIRKEGIRAKPAALLVKLESVNPRKALGLASRYVSGKLKSEQLEEALRQDKRPTRRVGHHKLIEVSADDRRVTLKAYVIPAALSTSDKARLRESLGEFLAHVGLEAVQAPHGPGGK